MFCMFPVRFSQGVSGTWNLQDFVSRSYFHLFALIFWMSRRSVHVSAGGEEEGVETCSFHWGGPLSPGTWGVCHG